LCAPNAGLTISAACYRRRPWEVRSLHAFGVDDAAPRGLALRQILFFVWATFAEHKLVILGERRSKAEGRILLRAFSPQVSGTRAVKFSGLNLVSAASKGLFHRLHFDWAAE